MKKFTVMLFTSIMISLLSCSNSDDNNNSSASIIGKWQPAKLDIEVNGQIEWIDSKDEDFGCDLGHITFLENNTIHEIGYDDKTGTCEQYEEKGTWKLVENKVLTITFPNEKTSVFEVIRLTKNELHVKTISMDENGETIMEHTLHNKI